MEPSSLHSGWCPPPRSMIDRRRMVMPNEPSTYTPSSSGPRCAMSDAILWRSRPSAGRPSRLYLPAMPHMSAAPLRALANQVAIKLVEPLDHAFRRQFSLDFLATPLAHPLRDGGLLEQLDDSPGHRGGVLRRYEKAGHTLLDDFRRPA